jgi:hypothetical protein
MGLERVVTPPTRYVRNTTLAGAAPVRYIAHIIYMGELVGGVAPSRQIRALYGSPSSAQLGTCAGMRPKTYTGTYTENRGGR